jgi:geranylgeranyl pyrophosphate synthase
MNRPATLFPSHLPHEVDELMGDLERAMERMLLHDTGEKTPANRAVDAAIYHLKSGGRRIRGRLALHVSLSLGLSVADALALAATVEFLHNASLVHDDLQDDDLLRHGMPTAAAAFGSNVAICTGDLLVSAAYSAVAGFSRTDLLPKLITSVHAATVAAIRGQCAGLPQAGLFPKDLNLYRQIAEAKSGALLGLPMQLAFLAAEHDEWMSQASQAAAEFAVGYQIMDDIEDVEGDGPTAMNIVNVLKNSGYADTALAAAFDLGVQHLKNAATLAEMLPSHAGSLLKNLATSLGRFHPVK